MFSPQILNKIHNPEEATNQETSDNQHPNLAADVAHNKKSINLLVSKTIKEKLSQYVSISRKNIQKNNNFLPLKPPAGELKLLHKRLTQDEQKANFAKALEFYEDEKLPLKKRISKIVFHLKNAKAHHIIMISLQLRDVNVTRLAGYALRCFEKYLLEIKSSVTFDEKIKKSIISLLRERITGCISERCGSSAEVSHRSFLKKNLDSYSDNYQSQLASLGQFKFLGVDIHVTDSKEKPSAEDLEILANDNYIIYDNASKRILCVLLQQDITKISAANLKKFVTLYTSACIKNSRLLNKNSIFESSKQQRNITTEKGRASGAIFGYTTNYLANSINKLSKFAQHGQELWEITQKLAKKSAEAMQAILPQAYAAMQDEMSHFSNLKLTIPDLPFTTAVINSERASMPPHRDKNKLPYIMMTVFDIDKHESKTTQADQDLPVTAFLEYKTKDKIIAFRVQPGNLLIADTLSLHCPIQLNDTANTKKTISFTYFTAANLELPLVLDETDTELDAPMTPKPENKTSSSHLASASLLRNPTSAQTINHPKRSRDEEVAKINDDEKPLKRKR